MAARSSGKKRSTRSLLGDHPQMLILLVVFFAVMVIFMAALVDLQAIRPDRYRDLAQDQSSASRSIAGYRGQILDREGYVLAASTPTQLIIADPQIVKKKNNTKWTASLLAPILGMDAELLEQLLAPSSEEDRYNVIATTSDQEVLGSIRKLVADDSTTKAFAGIVIRPEEERLYPAGSLAQPLVGRVDPDEIGRSGVEEQFDETLRGTSGVERYERGIFGSISVAPRIIEPAAKGNDLTLTLDHRIQYGTESILIETCEKLGAAGATAIVSNPKTGEIYGMASVERVDETQCGVASYNKAVIDTFEPGSVMKLVSFAAAADSLGYTAEDTLIVPRAITVADKRFTDHPDHPEQEMTIAQAMGQSSNVAAITLSQQLGSEEYFKYATNFGFGQLSGLDLRGESSGVLRSPAEWQGSDAGSIVIGQGMTVNLMQLSSAFNTVANNGVYIEPTLVSALNDDAGGEKVRQKQVTRSVISPEAATETLKMLTAVTGEGGTGFKAAIDGYTVAGKTGTAWKVFDNGSGRLTYGTDKDRRYLTTFGGLVPAEDPELSVVLVIDEPRTATSATTAAAPTFAQIAQYSLRVLDIAPALSDKSIPAWRQERLLVRGTPAPAAERARASQPGEAETVPDAAATTEPQSPGDPDNVEEIDTPGPIELPAPEIVGETNVITLNLSPDPSEQALSSNQPVRAVDGG